jgi:hypothetical protein
MPLESKAQTRFMFWAHAHPGESGVPRKVSNEFVGTYIKEPGQHKGALKGLPERVGQKKPKPFGSLAP